MLYFLRHAEAEDRAISDQARALTAKGREQADAVGTFMKTAGLQPALILTSPYVRARETAQRVSKKLGGVDVVEDDFLGCGMGLERLRAGIQPYFDQSDLLLVGHEPDFSHCLSGLLGAGSVCVNVRKASLTALALQGHHSPAVLEFCVPAKFIKRSLS